MPLDPSLITERQRREPAWYINEGTVEQLFQRRELPGERELFLLLWTLWHISVTILLFYVTLIRVMFAGSSLFALPVQCFGFEGRYRYGVRMTQKLYHRGDYITTYIGWLYSARRRWYRELWPISKVRSLQVFQPWARRTLQRLLQAKM